MAYVANQQDEEEPKNPAQGAVPPAGGAGSAGVQLAPSSGVGSVGGGTPTPGQPVAGGQFATLDKYITANQGQAEPLANKITSGISNEYSTLSGQNTSTLNDIGNQVTAGSAPSNANDIIAREAANPVSFANSTVFPDTSKENVKQFQGLLNASYGGPASAEGTTGFTTQQNAVNNAIAAGNAATSTEAGRSQLLAKNEAAPSTSVTGLNSAILSQSPDALNQVENAYKPFSNLLTGLTTGAQGINTNISKAKSDASTINSTANKQIADQINALNTNVNSEYSALQGKYTTANSDAAKLASNLQAGILPIGAGVDPGLQSFISQNVNPWFTQYANQYGGNHPTPTYNFANAVPQFASISAPTLNQAATTQDYNSAGAFQNLLAGLNTGIAAPTISSADAAQAGTYKIPALPNVNNKTLASDIFGSINTPTNWNLSYGPGTYNPTSDLKFGALLTALNKYLGNPWSANLNNTMPNGSNPYQQYQPTIS